MRDPVTSTRIAIDDDWDSFVGSGRFVYALKPDEVNVFAGVSHFTNTEFFVAIMPPYLPAHLELVYLSGVFEVLGGLGILVPKTRRLAGFGLIALLVAVYPANIHMALNPEQFVPEGGSAVGLYVRLPEHVTNESEPRGRFSGNAYIERWSIRDAA